MIAVIKAIFYLVLLNLGFADVVYYQPEQVHLSYGNNISDIVVTWTTFNDTNSSVVEYGTYELSQSAKGFRTLFTDGGNEQRKLYIHRVILTDLKPGTKYLYHCGSLFGWSDLFYFQTPPSNEVKWSPSLAVFGDLGMANAQSLSRLQKDILKGMYDAILHVGDFAYDMDTDNAKVGDQFMRQIEPIASSVPYMVCVGNHEQKYNFSNYKNRFSMPGSENSLMYSFNMGPVHFIALSTEFYYYTKYGIKQVFKQYSWLENDLKIANLPENRKKHPWIITFGHRPMYCSNAGIKNCDDSLVRKGLPVTHWFGLEKLFYDSGVDLEFWAHEHSYERLWPLYNDTIYNGSTEYPYTNPKAPVHIITGSAGCQEDHTPFEPYRPPWSAFRSTDYGYSRLKIYNETHLYLEQVSDDQNGKIIDNMWIIKNKHGSYSK